MSYINQGGGGGGAAPLNTQARVTFQASSDQPLSTDHCSIGIQSTIYNTKATPVELTFSGGHGFSILAGASITSDWVNFPFTTAIGDVYSNFLNVNDDGEQGISFRFILPCNGGVMVVVIADLTATGPYGMQKGPGASLSFFKTGATYNQANPTGMQFNLAVCECVSLIETQ